MKMQSKLSVMILVLILALTSHSFAEPQSRELLPNTPTAIIVLDPGHGGDDEGVKGPDGNLEKDLMLEMANKIRARLVPDYKVYLTRDDDYQVALTDRTGLANSSDATLLVSLHAGAGFTPRSEVTTIYLHSPTSSKALPDTESDNAPLTQWQWQHQQDRHQKESQRLGDLLASQLAAMPSTPSVVMESAHLVVLAGADQPAVLIEFGDLNSTAGEKRLSDTEWQQQCAGAVAAAVREFINTQRQ
jgi:N-acetylmuramoyl-L-alanine amidase